ncbi:MAG: hypothetical protein V3U24_01865 [Candidatus Neomarinimicrobiota bacterium]
MFLAIHHISRLVAPGILVWGLAGTFLWGQACCTLQGFNGSAAYGSLWDFDGLDFANPRNHTQIQFQLSGSDDWDRDSFITNGPLLSYSLIVNHFARRSLLVGAAVSGNFSTISEMLTIQQNESSLALHTLQLRSSWFSGNRRHAFWSRLILPFVSHYSNRDFPFILSPARSVEIGYGYVKNYVNSGGKGRVISLRANVRKDGRTDNLYQFTYYSTGEVALRYRIYSDIVPFVSLFAKHGALKPLDVTVYQTRFPATLFTYGLVGAGLEYKGTFLQGLILRLYGYYPTLRWSNNVLPAGFEEKPVLGLTLTTTFSMERP